jgi:hypothetical protein
MCHCLSKAVALFYAPRQRSQFGQKQINRKECNAFSAGNRSASVEFISAERTIESYKLLPIELSQEKTMWLNSDRSMPSSFKLS